MQFSKEEWDLHGRPGKAHWAAWENSRRTLGDVSGQEISNPDADYVLTIDSLHFFSTGAGNIISHGLREIG